MKLAPARFGRTRPYILEFQPDGYFSGFRGHNKNTIDELAQKKLLALGLVEPPAYIDDRLQVFYEIGDDKAAHLPLLGEEKHKLLPAEILVDSIDADAEEILQQLKYPQDVVLKHRNMSRGEGVFYVENAQVNLQNTLDAARSSNGKLAVFRNSKNGFVVQQGIKGLPVNADGQVIRNAKQSTGLVFDATLRYVIIVEITPQKQCKTHSLAAYWKFPLHPIASAIDINSRIISDAHSNNREHPKSAIVSDAQLKWLEKNMNPELNKLFNRLSEKSRHNEITR